MNFYRQARARVEGRAHHRFVHLAPYMCIALQPVTIDCQAKSKSTSNTFGITTLLILFFSSPSLVSQVLITVQPYSQFHLVTHQSRKDLQQFSTGRILMRFYSVP